MTSAAGATEDPEPPMTREEAWADYFARHPEVLASWNHQNGYWPYGYGPDGIQEEGQ